MSVVLEHTAAQISGFILSELFYAGILGPEPGDCDARINYTLDLGVSCG